MLLKIVWLWFAVAVGLATFFRLPAQLARAFTARDPEAIGAIAAYVVVVVALLLTRRKVWPPPPT